MNREDLARQLADEGFNPRAYSLTDDERADFVLCLRRQEEGWRVFYRERGIEREGSFFYTEHDACEFFLQEMRNDPTTKSSWTSGFSIHWQKK